MDTAFNWGQSLFSTADWSKKGWRKFHNCLFKKHFILFPPLHCTIFAYFCLHVLGLRCKNHQDRDPPNLLAQVSPLFCNPAKKMSNPVGNFACFGLCLFSTIIISIIMMILTIKASYSLHHHHRNHP